MLQWEDTLYFSPTIVDRDNKLEMFLVVLLVVLLVDFTGFLLLEYFGRSVTSSLLPSTIDTKCIILSFLHGVIDDFGKTNHVFCFFCFIHYEHKRRKVVMSFVTLISQIQFSGVLVAFGRFRDSTYSMWVARIANADTF